jgi:GxxExxY protein
MAGEKWAMGELILKEEAYAVVGAAMAVHGEMGSGFLEPVYQECMEVELAERGIEFISQQGVKLRYRGHELKQRYVPDLVCYDRIIVELKAAACLMPEHRAQMLNYLKATGLQLGLLINFGSSDGLEFERLVR